MSDVNWLRINKNEFLEMSSFFVDGLQGDESRQNFFGPSLVEKICWRNFVADKKKVFGKSEEVVVLWGFCGWSYDNSLHGKGWTLARDWNEFFVRTIF